MKILITADPIGGVWTYALELARALARHDVDLALATMGAPLSRSQRDSVSRLTNVTLFESRFALEWMDEPWRDVDLAGEWLLDVASRFDPDLIHLNGYAHAALDWNAPVLVVAHSCVFSWWRAVKRTLPPPRFDEYYRRVRAGLERADLVTAPTAAMLASLMKEYKIDIDARVIPNAITRKQFAPSPKKPVVFSAGRLWDEAKNISLLDEVAPRVRWPIEVAGETLHPNGGEVRFEHAHSLGRITRDALMQHLCRAAIFALPARYEPFGLSPLEAALCSCVLVLGNIPSLREVWREAALYVSPDDPDELASVLNALIANTVRREEYGLRARACALQFSAQRMANEYMAAYHTCIARSPEEIAA
jgi:glycogen synthase